VAVTAELFSKRFPTRLEPVVYTFVARLSKDTLRVTGSSTLYLLPMPLTNSFSKKTRLVSVVKNPAVDDQQAIQNGASPWLE
jgi:hypothetical protein